MRFRRPDIARKAGGHVGDGRLLSPLVLTRVGGIGQADSRLTRWEECTLEASLNGCSQSTLGLQEAIVYLARVHEGGQSGVACLAWLSW